jgi:serine/threonine-protein kinase HSL1 (negative regulator of Swe1 kinase)
MTDNNLQINQISNRQYILSPAVQSGNDKESSSKDFYQGNKELPNLGRLGLGMNVFHRKTHMPYTIINFEKEKVSKLNLQEKINKTIDFMYKTSHPYLFRLLNHFETERHVVLIFEPYDGDSLDHIIEKGKCDLQTAIKYFVEIILGIQYLHNFGYYNINVCPENILIGECVKLTDYGIKMTGKNEGPKRATIQIKKGQIKYLINAYHTPEEIISIYKDENPSHGPKTDSWNCGILLFEMLTNFKSPFKGDTDKEYISSLINGEIDLSLINDEFCKDLISKLIKKNPEDRIDIEDILNMEYIKNVNIEQPEIDPSDNIINPEEEEEKTENENNDSEDNKDENKNEDINEVIKRLKAENERLKKALESRKDENNEINKNKIKALESININQNGGVESDSQKNILRLIEEKDNKNEKDKSFSSSSEKNDFADSSDDDLNNENLYVRCEKYKEKHINSKKKIKKLEKKIKNLNDKVNQLEKEKKKIEEQKTLNILNNFEKLNTLKINNINELSDIVTNSVNLFKESSQNLETLIDKLIAISTEEHISLIEENKKYIDNKGKIFFDTLENINNSGNKQKEIEMNKEREERKKLDKKKDSEIAELKAKYEISKQKEILLNEKIKALEERNNATSELNKSLMKKQEEIDLHVKELLKKMEHK